MSQVEDWQGPHIEVVSGPLGFNSPPPNVASWTDVENILTNAFSDIVSGGSDVAETLERYQSEIDSAANGG